MCLLVFQEIEEECHYGKKKRLFFRKKGHDKDTYAYRKAFMKYEVQTHDKKRELHHLLESRKPIELINMGKMEQIQDA